VDVWSAHCEKNGMPQAKTTTLRMSQGSQALNVIAALWSKRCAPARDVFLVGVQNAPGLPEAMKTTRATMVAMAAVISTRLGPCRCP